MKVLIMGAGGQGAPCASILSKDRQVSEIRLADISKEVLQKVSAKINCDKLRTMQVNAADQEEIIRAAAGVDVIIDLLNPAFFVDIMEAALAVGAHYVNTAWEEYIYEGFEEHDIQLGAKPKLYNEFKEKGLTAILGCGMTSGYTTNVIIRHYADKLDTMESVKIRLAKKDISIPEEEETLHAWNPGWNPRQAILDYVIPTYKFCDGQFIKMTEVFAEPEMWEFPEPFGKVLVAHHAHEEPFSIPFTFADKGLKYCDFKYYISKQLAPVIALGLCSEEEMEVNGAKIRPIDLVVAKVPHPGDGFLNEDPAEFAYLDKTKLVSIMVEIKGTKGGNKITYLINTPSPNTPRQVMYDLYGTSLITVALPAAIGAKMAAEGTAKGVISPQDMDADRFIELIRATGYPNQWEEKVTVEAYLV